MSLLPTLVAPADAAFLLPETREQPMHVGSLQLFSPPPGSDVHDLSAIYEAALLTPDVAPLFRKRLTRGITTLGQWAWEDDDAIDLEHHVRHSSLPKPGRIRELLALCSRLHGTLLDRHRPLWEMHLIEGLEDGRFAVYTKIHHALMDGVSGLRLLERSLSKDPVSRDTPMPFGVLPRKRRSGSSASLGDVVGSGLSALGDAVTLGPKVVTVLEHSLRHHGAVLPGTAPRSILNVPITGSRRFAGDAWSLDRMRAVARAADATLNDVVLAMSSGALRDYLQSLNALPDESLVAMTPVSLRQDDSAEGNAIGSILVSLGTHLEDPEARMLHLRESMNRGKTAFGSMSPLQATAVSAAVMSPIVLNSLFGVPPLIRPPFNVIISNVPGPREPLYWNGARLDGMYPLSIPTSGQALNITCTSYDTEMLFGLTGCRRSLPHLQRMLVGLDDALATWRKRSPRNT